MSYTNQQTSYLFQKLLVHRALRMWYPSECKKKKEIEVRLSEIFTSQRDYCLVLMPHFNNIAVDTLPDALLSHRLFPFSLFLFFFFQNMFA